jgi:hypothetical protein
MAVGIFSRDDVEAIKLIISKFHQRGHEAAEATVDDENTSLDPKDP